jgi:hypothetical protein
MANLEPKIIPVDSTISSKKKDLWRVIWSAAANQLRRPERPRDAVEGTAVVAGDQARASYPVRSRTAHFVRRAGMGAPLLSTHWVEGADSTRIG